LRRVTVCMAYYDNPTMLAKQAETFRAYPAKWRGPVQWIVVDDGSPRWPAEPQDSGIPLSIYRMTVDCRWNQDSCRNAGAHEAPDGSWLLLTDMDHLIPKETMEYVLTCPLEKGKIYKFQRVSAPGMELYKPHPNSWLMSKSTFWDRVGGYDERFSLRGGCYGTDSDFRNWCYAAVGEQNIEYLPVPLVRVPREVIPDASTTTYERKTDSDREIIRRVRKERGKAKQVTLAFEYKRVF
jgi:hypothetical protein